ncbi:MAG: hypothetical protein MJB14_04785 [Spirochaetes bacterium]|nr:hypothetical protein [Spirochaetota bacterium]
MTERKFKSEDNQKLISQVIEKSRKKGYIKTLPKHLTQLLPAIHNVELYLSFYGNDQCSHCITCSGPHRKETLSPLNAQKIISNIALYRIKNFIIHINGAGNYEFTHSPIKAALDKLPQPPLPFSNEILADYNQQMLNKDESASWKKIDTEEKLNFNRPSIRLSGGEFYCWPHQIEGKILTEAERLICQQELIQRIHQKLPEYDIWILTNGRFAESQEQADRVIQHWQVPAHLRTSNRIRISLSIDPFHAPPHYSNHKQMIKRIWQSALKHLHHAPYIYSLARKKIFLAGRALQQINPKCHFKGHLHDQVNDLFSESVHLETEALDLEKNNGCDEVKGFICSTHNGSFLANNLYIHPQGNLAYCCACVGNYGDFIHHPEETLKNMVTDPISVMLRHGKSAACLMNMAIQLDPSLDILKNTSFPAANGTICYQLLSGKRIKHK